MQQKVWTPIVNHYYKKLYDYIDIHTHSINGASYNTGAVYSIINTYLKDLRTPFSFGIHPYDVGNYDIKDLDSIFIDLTENPFFVAIGEIGLDFRFQDTVQKQISFFRRQLVIAKNLNKSVIIHMVKSLPQTLQIIKKVGYDNTFVFHSFRGNKSQADQIIQQGGYISISPKIPLELRDIWNGCKEYILLETDESEMDILSHYQNIADICSVSIEELKKQIFKNFSNGLGRKD